MNLERAAVLSLADPITLGLLKILSHWAWNKSDPEIRRQGGSWDGSAASCSQFREDFLTEEESSDQASSQWNALD